MAQDSSDVRIAVQECGDSGKWGKHCIYKLPASITDLKKKAYRPQTVSFGPYHAGSPRLGPMECHKTRVFNAFLDRCGRSKESFIGEFTGVFAGELMDAYHTLDRNREKFLEMMIRDGCFMLEAMGYFYHHGVEDFNKKKNKKEKYVRKKYDDKYYKEKTDPIFSKHGVLQMMPFIRRDMLLLENQLPLQLLIKLLSLGGHVKLTDSDPEETPDDHDKYWCRRIFDRWCNNTEDSVHESTTHDKDLLDGPDTHHGYIIKLMVNFCNPFTNNLDFKYADLKNSKHALDVHRQLLISGTVPEKPGPWSKWWKDWCKDPAARCCKLLSPKLPPDWRKKAIGYGSNIIPSATRLSQSGISIRKSDSKSIKKIEFFAGPLGGVLEIPEIVVDTTTEPVFRNLMAYERMHHGVKHEVTSYVSFMDDIIDNAGDVKILQDHEVLWNAYGSDAAVANLFNSLSDDATVDLKNPLVRVRYHARTHSRRALNKVWGDVIHVCFNNPRTAVVTVVTLLAFGLGITDTFFNIKEKAN